MINRVILDDYFRNSETAFTIPDIGKGYIPQGMDFDAGSDSIFITGYMDFGKNSPIYQIDRSSGTLKKKILMTDESGEKFSGHSGGLAIFDGKLSIAGSMDNCVYSFRMDDILSAETENELSMTGKTVLKTDSEYIRVSFVTRDESLLYAGEFHRDPIFYTPDSHKAEQEGIKHKAYLLGFSVDEDSNAVLSRVYSLPDSIQGACFSDGYLFLSQSSGFLPGRILSYDLSRIQASETRTVLGKEIPMYFISEKKADKVTRVPPMPEEIVVIDGQLYILHEAASNRYLIGKWLGLDKVRRTPVEYFIQ